MQQDELQRNGRLLISRAGQMCYVRNKLLAREGDLLSRGDVVFSDGEKARRLRRNKRPTTDFERKLREEHGARNFHFMSPPNANVAKEVQKLAPTAESPKPKTSSSESPQNRRHADTRVCFHAYDLG